ncbi:MAG: phytanoyl-CoA dioxygenase family protein [Verrucomicrobiae bacterium]|nr:phytanoyl-CoA dioxygenase family protein [Verrucomicrobiae bacterium]
MKAPTQIPELNYTPGFVPQLMEAVNACGVVKVFGAIDSDTLARLRVEYDEILATDEAGVKDLGVEVGKACNVIRAELAEGRFPATMEFFSRPWMQEASDLYWGEPRILNDNIFVTREIPGTQHLAQSLHFDVQETLKFFLYLNDVTRENGAFSCVPGSIGHTRAVRAESGSELSYENREYSRQHPFSEEEIVPVEGPAGTLIVFTTEVWHRAGLVSSGERHVMRGHTRTPIGGKARKKKNSEEGRKADRPKRKKRSWLQRLFKR